MADRLAELLRQRALLQEHLAWLEREIAAASGRSTTQPAPPAAAEKPPTTLSAVDLKLPIESTTTMPMPVSARAASPAQGMTVAEESNRVSKAPLFSAGTVGPGLTGAPVSPGSADEIIEQFRTPPDALRTDVRKGCLLYFAAAFGLLILGVAVLYLAFRR